LLYSVNDQSAAIVACGHANNLRIENRQSREMCQWFVECVSFDACRVANVLEIMLCGLMLYQGIQPIKDSLEVIPLVAA